MKKLTLASNPSIEAMLKAFVAFVQGYIKCKDAKISAVSKKWEWHRNCRGRIQWCEIAYDARSVLGFRIGGHPIANCWRSNGSLVFSVFDRRFDKIIAEIADRFTEETGIKTIVMEWAEEHRHNLGYDFSPYTKLKALKTKNGN